MPDEIAEAWAWAYDEVARFQTEGPQFILELFQFPRLMSQRTAAVSRNC